MNILLYTSFNERSIAIESILLYFQKNGVTVFFLTTCSKGSIHTELEKNSVKCYSSRNESPGSLFKNLREIFFLVKFCKKNRIDIIHSHLQMPNIYAVIAKFFVPAKIITVRHNSDVMYLFGTKKEKWIEKIINRFSPCIIAISNKVKQQLIEFEGVKERKVVRINNGYDFSKYEGLSILKENNVLRDSYKNKFVILSPGRLIASKRHHLCIEAMPELLKFQPTIHLLIIGDGPEKKSFQLLIDKLDLSASVSIISYKENITDYIKIANVVVQLSISEASNNSIKEAAYFEKTCVVCKDVGDFSDYIIHNRSGFLLDKNNPKFELIECIKKMFSSEADYGKELKKEVLKQFSIDKIGMEYDELHRQILEMK